MTKRSLDFFYDRANASTKFKPLRLIRFKCLQCGDRPVEGMSLCERDLFANRIRSRERRAGRFQI